VQQSIDDVHFRIESFCDIFFIPLHTDLILVNIARQPLDISSTRNTSPEILLPGGKFRLTSPESWCISQGAQLIFVVRTGLKEYVTIQTPPLLPASSLKRRVDDGLGEPEQLRATKRLRGGERYDEDPTIHALVGRENADTTIISLKEAETFIVPGPNGYCITKHKDITPATAKHSNIVFTATHSKIPECVVVKLLSKAPTTIDKLVYGARSWLQEKSILEKLNHVSC
jgi:hypothetical protein